MALRRPHRQACCAAYIALKLWAPGLATSSTLSLRSFLRLTADGDPLGFFLHLFVLWEKIRRPVVATWRARVLRPYNWAAKGRSPQAAVWKEALRSEAACARGHSSGAVLIDLVKAFEFVKLELIWYAGLRLGFPVTMLVLILESFSLRDA